MPEVKRPMLKLRKILSGGQTGADQAGLEAGRLLGLETEGWVPKGCRTLIGPDPELVSKYGCKEHWSSSYPPRTNANVEESDATVRFAKDFQSPGEKCTWYAIQRFSKPYCDIAFREMSGPIRKVMLQQLRSLILDYDVEVLNVAGNSEQTAPGIYDFVLKYLLEALKGHINVAVHG